MVNSVSMHWDMALHSDSQNRSIFVSNFSSSVADLITMLALSSISSRGSSGFTQSTSPPKTYGPYESAGLEWIGISYKSPTSL